MRGKTLNKPLYIGNIYRPPKENLEFYNQFIEEVAPILVNLDKNNKDVILAGDFNIDFFLNKWETYYKWILWYAYK